MLSVGSKNSTRCFPFFPYKIDFLGTGVTRISEKLYTWNSFSDKTLGYEMDVHCLSLTSKGSKCAFNTPNDTNGDEDLYYEWEAS